MKFNIFILALLCAANTLQADYIFQRGRLLDANETATMSVHGHYDAAAKAYGCSDWREAAKHFSIITINFPDSMYCPESFYFLGVCNYFMEEYDFANEAFSQYLKEQANPNYFQNTIDFKFAVAEQLSSGAKRRPLGTKKLPKWACGKNLALTIYDEVIAAVPCSDLAAKALMSKAFLFWRMQNYRPAVDSLQMVIRRFPKYEKTPDCYLYIGKIFLEQSRYEFQNSDILAFAQINFRKFERDFPRDERLCEAQADVMAIKEIYANGLYETGRFYERTCKPSAAMIYYSDAIKQFPDTRTAETCRNRLISLYPSFREEVVSAMSDNGPTQEDLNFDFNSEE
jgi:outer membrane protein assembly factor BamD (BamD/ComL family)